MIRASALALLVLVSAAVMLPLVDSSAHNKRPAVHRHSHMGHHHSRAWWRRHRARLRRLRAAMKRQRELQAMRGQSLNAAAESHNLAATDKFSVVGNEFKNPVSAMSLPNGWSRRGAANGEMKFVVSGENGQAVGTATISLVNAQPSGEMMMTARGQRKALGGVPFTDLRRTVIDKMIAANGWVVNDFAREINGKPVFIVQAQTAASTDGRTPQLAWTYYFTEIDGRIYSLTTSSLQESSNRVADDSAQVMSSLLANSRPTPVETSQR
jgi:hypothetical protein